MSEDKKLLPGLIGTLDEDILSELIDEDPKFRLMKKAILSYDFEGFSRIDPFKKSFWKSAAKVDGCIIIGDRNAFPMCLQRAVLTRLH